MTRVLVRKVDYFVSRLAHASYDFSWGWCTAVHLKLKTPLRPDESVPLNLPVIRNCGSPASLAPSRSTFQSSMLPLLTLCMRASRHTSLTLHSSSLLSSFEEFCDLSGAEEAFCAEPGLG